MARLSEKDKKVIQSFTYRQQMESENMLSTGDRLDGKGEGLKGVAFWKGNKIWLVKTKEKGALTIQNHLKLIHVKSDKDLIGGYKDYSEMKKTVMRRSASEIIRDLEIRIAQLEKESEYKSKFDRLHDLHKRSVKKYNEKKRSMEIYLGNLTVEVQESSNEDANFLNFRVNGKTFESEDKITQVIEAIQKALKGLSL